MAQGGDVFWSKVLRVLTMALVDLCVRSLDASVQTVRIVRIEEIRERERERDGGRARKGAGNG